MCIRDRGYLAGEQLVKNLIGAMEWTRDQVNAFSDSMLGDITEADMADYCSSRYKHEPTTENLQACMRARY